MTRGELIPAANVLLVAFVALCLEQVVHEVSHGVAAYLVGARWERLFFWAADWSLPEGSPAGASREVIIAGSAALINIVCALACIFLLSYTRGGHGPLLRLFLLFFGAYSLFAGFGYIFFDPIFARPTSLGDWARVVMLLGGGWAVRLPLIAAGAAGTIYGYYWMGQSAMHFSLTGAPTHDTQVKTGFILCVLPYVANNLIFSVFALFHPLGKSGFLLVSLKLWFGFLGFVLAFMINFVWRPHAAPYPVETIIPGELRTAWLVIVAVTLLAVVVLLRGVRLNP